MKTIKLFLKYIKATGKDSSGSRCVIIRDCILRFDNEGKIWTIVSDDQRNVVVQAKTAVSNIKNPCPIPAKKPSPKVYSALRNIISIAEITIQVKPETKLLIILFLFIVFSFFYNF